MLAFFETMVYNIQALKRCAKIKYRGVEQLEARRAHNPEAAGSSPVSATKKNNHKGHSSLWLFFFILRHITFSSTFIC